MRLLLWRACTIMMHKLRSTLHINGLEAPFWQQRAQQQRLTDCLFIILNVLALLR